MSKTHFVFFASLACAPLGVVLMWGTMLRESCLQAELVRGLSRGIARQVGQQIANSDFQFVPALQNSEMLLIINPYSNPLWLQQNSTLSGSDRRSLASLSQIVDSPLLVVVSDHGIVSIEVSPGNIVGDDDNVVLLPQASMLIQQFGSQGLYRLVPEVPKN